MNPKNHFAPALPAVGAASVQASAATLTSPDPPPAIGLNDTEIEVYEYLCESLRQAGIEHLTAGMPLAVIVRTFMDWLTTSALTVVMGLNPLGKQ